MIWTWNPDLLFFHVSVSPILLMLSPSDCICSHLDALPRRLFLLHLSDLRSGVDAAVDRQVRTVDV